LRPLERSNDHRISQTPKMAHDRDRDPGDAVLSLFCQERLDDRTSRGPGNDETLWPNDTSFATRSGRTLVPTRANAGNERFSWRHSRAVAPPAREDAIGS